MSEMAHIHDEPHQHDYIAANIQYFNETAHKFDSHPHALELAPRQAAAMLKAYPFDENTTTVMDFACGTGLISKELASHAKFILGVDISQGVVDEYNKRVNNQGISPEEMKAICVQLKGEPGELDDARFDVIVCAAAYHHFPSIEDTTRILAYFLKPGGVLLVTDSIKSEESDQMMEQAPSVIHHIVPHKGGFHEADIKQAFEAAGLQFSFEILAKGTLHKFPAQLFLAKGIKA